MKTPFWFSFLLLLTVACTESAVDHSAPKSMPRAEAAPTTAPASASTSSTPRSAVLRIQTQAQETIGEIRPEGTKQHLQFEGQQLQGRLKGAKRKYANASGQIVAEVKSNDTETFKLRNPDGSLRWKVKLYEDKVKISDNEENENPYQIKTSEGKFKLKDAQNEEIGRIEGEGETVFVSSDRQQYILNAPLRMSYGVLLIPNMTRQDQMILLAELQDRGY